MTGSPAVDLPAVLRAGLLDPAARAALDWQPFRPGVEAHWLHRSPDGGPAAALLRYAPGSEVPRHAHIDTGCTALLIWERAPRLYEGT